MSRCARKQNDPSSAEWTDKLNDGNAQTTDAGLKNIVAELKRLTDGKYKIAWDHVIIVGFLHLGALYGLYLMLTSAKILTPIFGKY